MALRSAIRLTGVVCFAASLGACAAPPAPVTAQLPAMIPSITAQTLVGATPALLNAQFGPPALRRVDGTAQVWLYHSPVCGLNLILYPDHAGVPRVASAVPDNGDAQGCVASMARGLTDAALEPAPPS